MKSVSVLLLVSLLGVSSGEGPYPASSGPYPPSGWKPSATLVLPQRQQQAPPQSSYGPPAPTNNSTFQVDEESDQASKDPAEEQEVGSYLVLLEDGRLQRIQFVANPQGAATGFQGAANSFQGTPNSFQGSTTRFQGPVSNAPQQPSAFRQPNVEHNKVNRPSVNLQSRKGSLPAEAFVAQFNRARGPLPHGTIANLEVTNVNPLMGPVYAYNQAPLIRIIRQLP